MSIPFLDLERLHATIRDDLDAAFDDVVRGSAFIGGAAVLALEEAFAGAHGAVAAASCGSGTDALALSLRVLGVGPGDEVIVPSMTFVATAEAVVHVGATPVIADVNPTTLLLDDDRVVAVLTERTKAVIPVHLYGHVVPFHQIEQWRARGLLVVEDAAQAHLASWGPRMVGSAGHVACFSFYPGKNLGALGDGGMITSTDEALVQEVRRLRDHGRSGKYVHDVVGWCSRLDGLQARFLLAKLPHLVSWNAGRREAAAHYRDAIGEHLVPWEDGAVHHLLVARVPSRDELRERLHERGVSTGVHYPIPLSRQPSLAPWSRACAVAEQAGADVLSLPMDPLMAAADVRAVCEALVSLLE